MIIIDAVTVTIVNFVALLSARSRLGAILIALGLAALNKMAINKHRTGNRNEKRHRERERRESIMVQHLIGFAEADLIHK